MYLSSIMFGVLASVLPNLFCFWLQLKLGNKAPEQLLRFVYFIEGLKFAGLALLVSVFLQWPGLHIIKFFSAFMLSEMIRLFYHFFKLTRV